MAVPPTLNAVVIQRLDINPGLMILRVAPLGWELPAFKAGQFAVLGLPASTARSQRSLPEEPAPDPEAFLRRAYSIASSSREREYLEFYLVEVRSGALTPRLFTLRQGDRLWLGPKFTGLFTLDQVDRDRNVVLVGTGTGLAPYMSMLRTHLDGGSDRRIAVIHGARHSHDLGYRTELFHLQRQARNLTYLPVITSPQTEPEPWIGHTGRLQDFWRQGEVEKAWGFRPTPADTDFFLCGNPAMVESMQALLETEGFSRHTPKSPGQIHFEAYW